MKPLLFLLFILLTICQFLYSQELSVNETIDYIRTNTKKYSIKQNLTEYYDTKITVSENGYINITEYHVINGSTYEATNITFHCAQNITIREDNNQVSFVASDYVIQRNDSKTSITWLSTRISIEAIEKVVNAYNYLLQKVRSNPNFNKDDNDPFSNSKVRNKPTFSSLTQKTIDSVNLKYQGNLSKINISICGITTEMILDSGAEIVTISEDLEQQLIQQKLIAKENYLPPSLFKLADGTIIKARKLVIPYIEIGSYKIKNITCSVMKNNSDMLLGKIVLNIFKKWSIDNIKHMLILEN